MRDLSKLAAESIWSTSQAAGNRQSSNELAMTAAGSPPVDPEVPGKNLANPHVSVTSDLAVGEDGKPQASGQVLARPWNPPPPRWGPVTAPDVLRKAPQIKNGQRVPSS